MKKLVLFLIAVVFSVAGCKNNKPVESTILGVYTPYQMSMEKLNGKVEKVIETNYWAIPDGESYKKGEKMTRKQLDSLNYTSDFEATFDDAGDLVSCVMIDENKKTINKWELVKENNVLSKATYTYKDTIRSYHMLKCNTKGEIIEVNVFRPVVDTLTSSWIITKSPDGDKVTYEVLNYKGKHSYENILLYNKANQFLGYQAYNKEGKYNGGSEIKYNDQGKISGLIFYDKDKKATAENSFIYEYDSRGNWIKSVCKDTKGFAVIGERTYKYFD
jgi:hypothetical protein